MPNTLIFFLVFIVYVNVIGNIVFFVNPDRFLSLLFSFAIALFLFKRPDLIIPRYIRFDWRNAHHHKSALLILLLFILMVHNAASSAPNWFAPDTKSRDALWGLVAFLPFLLLLVLMAVRAIRRDGFVAAFRKSIDAFHRYDPRNKADQDNE